MIVKRDREAYSIQLFAISFGFEETGRANAASRKKLTAVGVQPSAF